MPDLMYKQSTSKREDHHVKMKINELCKTCKKGQVPVLGVILQCSWTGKELHYKLFSIHCEHFHKWQRETHLQLNKYTV